MNIFERVAVERGTNFLVALVVISAVLGSAVGWMIGYFVTH